MVRICLTRGKNIDDLSRVSIPMLLNGNGLTKLVLTCMNRPKKLCKQALIVPRVVVGLIDALPISDILSDGYALISLKCDDPEAGKRLWLHHINGTPNQRFTTGLGMYSFECSMF